MVNGMFTSPSCLLPPAELARCVIEHQKSQFNEDVLLLPMLLLPFPSMLSNRDSAARGMRDSLAERRGSYVELGAFDGVNKSNTYALEHCCGWTGTLIEGNPSNFAKLQRSGRKGRMVHSAVCSVPGHVNMSATGDEFAMVVTEASRGPRVSMRRRSAEVPCDKLSSILDANGATPLIDFLSLDVEGAEETVLSTIDPTRFKLIVLEVQKTSKKDHSSALNRIDRMLTGAGMVMPPWVRIHNSRVYAWANLTVVHVPGVRLYRPVRMPTESGLESALRETMQVIGTQQQEEAQQVQEDQVANARGARRASTSKYRRPSTSTSVGNPPR